MVSSRALVQRQTGVKLVEPTTYGYVMFRLVIGRYFAASAQPPYQGLQHTRPQIKGFVKHLLPITA